MFMVYVLVGKSAWPARRDFLIPRRSSFLPQKGHGYGSKRGHDLKNLDEPTYTAKEN